MEVKQRTKRIIQSPIQKFGAHLLWGIVAAILFLGLFTKLVEDLLFQEVATFDRVVTGFIQSFSSVPVTKGAIFITHIGSGATLVCMMLLVGSYLLFRLKHIWETVILATSLLGGALLNGILKFIFRRTRPDIEHLVEVGGYSFPSGHAMVSAAFYGMLGYLLWINLRERSKLKLSWCVVVLTLTLIIAIGISRIYLGVHFPSDVVAGFAAGGAWVASCIVALHVIRYYKGERKAK
ncbi:phosphatase PAP2 family protein [Aneurinibacillus aneurinilyticus]|uniref:Phosphatase PAP2 family protein n=1 Tax=Aneurinibacillus aneurinilyticus TaxID=1391 RepID=A0A848D5B2_ANEAE|nr:phosphatase PAP2 family protein [Aneurinibacillus aneurinilyticus]MCI1696305.1 phosphatase PAP2 family protein [Aneurinibacillus aneurinilyticus]MED0673385.1 phosphatase PAP2 family protein [Aneurinibacillus aneurinilyticus]NMF00871.1 phosphatase PAP2 family protein [Aneurinibacillus aneurinilyticus]